MKEVKPINVERSDIYDKWLKGLKDSRARARILTRTRRLEQGNPGDVEAVGEGVSEMKTNVKEKVLFAKYDAADYINTKEDVLAMLEVALEEDDPDLLLEIIGDIARSKGMTKIAKELDIDRRGLYKSLSPGGNPSFKTVFKLFDILGMRVRLEPKAA